MINKLTEKNISAARSKFIIGSIGENGISFAKNPSLHDSIVSAQMEIARLCRLEPGKTYIYVQICGSAYMPSPELVWN